MSFGSLAALLSLPFLTIIALFVSGKVRLLVIIVVILLLVAAVGGFLLGMNTASSTGVAPREKKIEKKQRKVSWGENDSMPFDKNESPASVARTPASIIKPK